MALAIWPVFRAFKVALLELIRVVRGAAWALNPFHILPDH